MSTSGASSPRRRSSCGSSPRDSSSPVIPVTRNRGPGSMATRLIHSCATSPPAKRRSTKLSSSTRAPGRRRRPSGRTRPRACRTAPAPGRSGGCPGPTAARRPSAFASDSRQRSPLHLRPPALAARLAADDRPERRPSPGCARPGSRCPSGGCGTPPAVPLSPRLLATRRSASAAVTASGLSTTTAQPRPHGPLGQVGVCAGWARPPPPGRSAPRSAQMASVLSSTTAPGSSAAPPPRGGPGRR